MNYEKLKKYEPIMLLGHDNADNDSITSVYFMKKLFDFLNIKSDIVILDNEIPSTFNYEKYPFKYNTKIFPTSNVLLVDHTKTQHQCNIIGYIDHHTLSFKETETTLKKPQSSCAKIILDEMIRCGMNLDKDIYYLAVKSLYLDTLSFKSKKSIEEDKIWAEENCDKYNFDKTALYNEGLMLADISNINQNTVLNDLKILNVNNNLIGTSCINLKHIPNNDIIDKLSQEIQYNQNLTKSDYWICFMKCIEDNKTIVLLSNKDTIIRKDFNGLKSRGIELKTLLKNKILFPDIEKNDNIKER